MTLRSVASLLPAALLVSVLSAGVPSSLAQAGTQAAPRTQIAPQSQAAPAAAPSAPDRAEAYYHDSLAHLYEDMAVNNGRQDYAAQAIDEYKLALQADPGSQYLQDGLADLYFKVGRIREAVTTAQDLVKKNPNDMAAHQLLGHVYLRSLNDMQGPQATEMLQLALGEYETMAKLKPADVETHLILGQLYGLNHESLKAEEQFKLARGLDSSSEEATLSIARLYAEKGDLQRAVDLLTAVPADDRGARVNLVLGSLYDQMRKPREAAEAYRAALEDEPENTDAQKALAAALLSSNQLEPALDQFKMLVAQEPTDVELQVKLAEVQRRLGHNEDALATLTKAKSIAPAGDASLEISFNQVNAYDALGRYDDAARELHAMLDATAHPDGQYSAPEKNNRALFLDRLGSIDREQNKTQDAVDAYKQLIALGGDFVLRGAQGEVDAYRDAHQYKQAVAVASDIAKAHPDDKAVQLLYAFQLADTGEADKGLALARAQLKNSADDRDTWIAIASTDMRLHRTQDALFALDKADALGTGGDNSYTLMLRATVLDQDKQYAAAEADYKKLLANDPDNATVLNDYGYMLADRGVQLPEALAMIQKAVTLDPQNGAYLDSLGWAQFKLGQYGAAETNLTRAIQRSSADPSLHDHLGDIYEKTGRLQLAVEQWQRSVEEYSHALPADADPQALSRVRQKLDAARVKLARNTGMSGRKS